MNDLFGDNVPQQPDTPQSRLYTMGLEIARRSGRAEDSVRKQLGALSREFDTQTVLNALLRSRDAEDPLTYARALLRRRRAQAPAGAGIKEFLNG